MNNNPTNNPNPNEEARMIDHTTVTPACHELITLSKTRPGSLLKQGYADWHRDLGWYLTPDGRIVLAELKKRLGK